MPTKFSWTTSQDACCPHKAPPSPASTLAHYWYTHHPGWKGLINVTDHLGSGTQGVGFLVTEGDNPDGNVPQQPAGLRREARWGAPIPRRRSTGRHGNRVARPDQQEGDIVNVLPQDECGELQERVDGFICVVGVWMLTVSDLVLIVVVGWVLEANESPWS